MLVVEKLTKRFGGLVVSDAIDLDVAAGEIHAVIGPNGAGKTTLINQLSGCTLPDDGRILFDGHNITREPADRRARLGLARTYQIISAFPNFTVLENAALAVQGIDGGSFDCWRTVSHDIRLIAPARATLAQVGLDTLADHLVATLPYGLQRLLDIAMVFALQPRLMLLDEPLAGLSPVEAADLARLLASLKGRYAMLLIEHDMDVVFALADRITVLVEGRVVASGSPSSIKADARVREAYLGTEISSR